MFCSNSLQTKFTYLVTKLDYLKKWTMSFAHFKLVIGLKQVKLNLKNII